LDIRGGTVIEDIVMVAHRFKKGQSVSFAPGGRSTSSSGRRYEILQQLPQEGRELLYRIKCKEEPFERMAKESELTRGV
jgi:hypothetical protein